MFRARVLLLALAASVSSGLLERADLGLRSAGGASAAAAACSPHDAHCRAVGDLREMLLLLYAALEDELPASLLSRGVRLCLDAALFRPRGSGGGGGVGGGSGGGGARPLSAGAGAGARAVHVAEACRMSAALLASAGRPGDAWALLAALPARAWSQVRKMRTHTLILRIRRQWRPRAGASH
jgi:hypothetical protein